MTVSDALLLGSVIAGILSALFAHRIRTPQRDPAGGPPSIAITGGAMADTFAIQQNTDAITRLAAAHEKRADVETDALREQRRVIEIADHILDELMKLRRAAEDIAAKQH